MHPFRAGRPSLTDSMVVFFCLKEMGSLLAPSLNDASLSPSRCHRQSSGPGDLLVSCLMAYLVFATWVVFSFIGDFEGQVLGLSVPGSGQFSISMVVRTVDLSQFSQISFFPSVSVLVFFFLEAY